MSEYQMTMPQEVVRIINTLEQHGYEAYAVGGCVRDAMLGREPEDWDITTSAKPLEVKRLFRKTIDTGLQHGTITVMVNGEGYEVTTYRIDGEYEDGRHPKEVAFTTSLRMDLERRDFTINAMAYNDRSGLVDEFDGVGDLKRGVIRCVGDAGQRLTRMPCGCSGRYVFPDNWDLRSRMRRCRRWSREYKICKRSVRSGSVLK